MNKPTQGPWYYMRGTRCVFGATHRAICTLHGPRKAESDERDANARLIASAPDLLEALRMLVACVKLEDCGDGYAEAVISSDEVRQARATIAKADGKQ
jgi:hypothetical protein